MSKTETVQTAYGETKIEVVECDSCGSTVSKESASRFAMEDTPFDVKMSDADRQGYACEHCVSEGPISFPEKAKQRLKIVEGSEDIIFGIGFWPLISVVMALHPHNEWHRGYARGSLGAWVWIIALSILVGVFMFF